MIVCNATRKIRIAGKVEKADTFFKRLFGLIPRKNLDEDGGLFLKPCSMIHTCFMRFPIDAVFLDEDLRVLRIENSMKPWRFSRWQIDADSVLELKSGKLKNVLGIGDILEFIE